MIFLFGLGVVGNAIYTVLKDKNIPVFGYDKYKENYNVLNTQELMKSKICFLCLPTPFIENNYNLTAMNETMELLNELKYNGLVIIKSTVNIGTTKNYIIKYPSLDIIHNPEFLTARTAYNDFRNQEHIVLGIEDYTNNVVELRDFYLSNFDNIKRVSICTTNESEAMKIFCNTFYACKVQIFNEFYLLCKETECNYSKVREMMLGNKWINPMHTLVPGPDGKFSYGGECLVKDTQALCGLMKEKQTPCDVINAVIEEQRETRN